LTLPIETRRLLLRDFDDGDFAAVHAYASDPEVTRFMFYGPRDEAETREYLREMRRSRGRRPRTAFELAIVRRDDARLIGACDLTLEPRREADLGFILALDAWGFGYASEAALALLDAGFAELGLTRIFATCDVANLASARVLERIGLRRRGILRRHREAKGRWWDMLLFDSTALEWRTRPQTPRASAMTRVRAVPRAARVSMSEERTFPPALAVAMKEPSGRGRVRRAR
jgi:RimJ/RimL family protein N-acetyltransferase